MPTKFPSLFLLFCLLPAPSLSATFTFTNNCPYTIWPGILSNAGSPPLSSTGFRLSPGESRPLSAPAPWSGRMWARTLCSTDSSSARFTCATGDCGSDAVECSGGGADPPATLAEFTLDGSAGMDFYDVSLVDGYNLPMLVVPQGGSGGSGCNATGCPADLNGPCPPELRVTAPPGGGATAACKSACEAFGSPEYCCSGAYGNPNTCRPSSYSSFFKNACPRAYSYAYDDATSTFTCVGADYLITFCPGTPSLKSTGVHPHPQAAGLPSQAAELPTSINGTMVYVGGQMETSSAVSPRCSPDNLLLIYLTLCFFLLLLHRLM